MATTSEVKAGLDAIASEIAAVRTRFESSKSSIQGGSTALGNIPTKYADVIATINAYTPTGAFETLSQDEKAKLQTEFVALKAELDALIGHF